MGTSKALKQIRLRFTTFLAHSSVLYSGATSEIGLVAPKPSPLQRLGLSLGQRFNALFKMLTGCFVVWELYGFILPLTDATSPGLQWHWNGHPECGYSGKSI